MTTSTTHSDGATSGITQAAIELGKLGYWVFPIKPNDKVPWAPHGYKSAKNGEAHVQKLFEGKDQGNLGISTHKGLVVVDIDPRNGGNESFKDLIEQIGHFPPTVQCFTAGGGMHYYFRRSDSIKGRSGIRPGIDIKAEGGYVVAPPSVNGSGGEYRWVEGHSPFDMEPAPIPDKLLHILNGGDNQAAALSKPNPEQKDAERQSSKIVTGSMPNPGKGTITEGSRNTSLTSLAATLNRRMPDPQDILRTVVDYNNAHCSPPLPEEEVSRIVESVCRYPSQDPVGETRYNEPPPHWEALSVPHYSIDEILEVYQEMMPGADPGMLRVSLAAYAANWLDSPAVWLMLISDPGTGKTRTLTALKNLPAIQPVSSLSEPALISGTPKQYRAEGATGGLLIQPRRFRVIVCDDFMGTLAEQKRVMNKLFTTLAAIKDGKLDKPLGADGGFTIHWRGKRGLLIGSTCEIDKHLVVHRKLAPRFLAYRRRPYKSQEGMSLPLPEEEAGLHKRLSEMIPGLFAGVARIKAVDYPISGEYRGRLESLARFLAQARGIVERDSGNSLISAPEVEPPGRLFCDLATLFRGYMIIGVDTDTAMKDIELVVMSTIGPPRSDVISALLEADSPLGEKAIRQRVSLSPAVTHRAVIDLEVLGVLHKTGSRSSSKYRLSDSSIVLRERSESSKGLGNTACADEPDLADNTMPKLRLGYDLRRAGNSSGPVCFMQMKTLPPSSGRVVGK